MNEVIIQEIIIEVLKEIQRDSGLSCPYLHGDIEPLNDIPEFDSVIYPSAIILIEDKLKISSPIYFNIFYDQKNLTIKEASHLIAKHIEGINSKN